MDQTFTFSTRFSSKLTYTWSERVPEMTSATFPVTSVNEFINGLNQALKQSKTKICSMVMSAAMTNVAMDSMAFHHNAGPFNHRYEILFDHHIMVGFNLSSTEGISNILGHPYANGLIADALYHVPIWFPGVCQPRVTNLYDYDGLNLTEEVIMTVQANVTVTTHLPKAFEQFM